MDPRFRNTVVFVYFTERKFIIAILLQIETILERSSIEIIPRLGRKSGVDLTGGGAASSEDDSPVVRRRLKTCAGE
jgi:hypothetical protein